MAPLNRAIATVAAGRARTGGEPSPATPSLDRASWWWSSVLLRRARRLSGRAVRDVASRIHLAGHRAMLRVEGPELSAGGVDRLTTVSIGPGDAVEALGRLARRRRRRPPGAAARMADGPRRRTGAQRAADGHVEARRHRSQVARAPGRGVDIRTTGPSSRRSSKGGPGRGLEIDDVIVAVDATGRRPDEIGPSLQPGGSRRHPHAHRRAPAGGDTVDVEVTTVAARTT